MNSPAWDSYLDSIFTSSLLSYLVTQFIWNTVELQYYSAGHWITYDEHAFSKQGTQSSGKVPNHTAVVLIGKALGLRKMGRKFISGLNEAYVEGNTVTSTFLADLATVLLAYITPVTGVGTADLTPGIVDKAGVFHPYVGGFVSAYLGTMRRRKPGIGI